MSDAAQFPPGKLLIGGEWVDSSSGKTFETINPATEEVLLAIAEADASDVDLAVRAARAAFDSGPWAAMPARERGRLLWKLGEALLERADQIGKLETLDNGKPIFESAKIDVPAAAHCFLYYAGWATKLHGETIPVGPDSFNYTLREPVGVAAAIVPWNFPLLLACWKVAPALAVGCTVILKPASLTPLTALKLGELALEVGFPPGVLNVIPGRGAVVGDALVRHRGVDKIAFTGETATGKEILRSSADTLKRLTLELGGKSPNIVLEDADLEAAARGATTGIFYGKGEVCAAGSRLLVHKSVHDALLEKVVERTKKMTPADPLHPKTRMGALVSKGQRQKVLSYVEQAQREGGELLCGGEPTAVGGKGYFVTPAVFDRVTNEMTLAREEVFGPVLATITFEDPEQAIAIANDTPYGLAAAVWTRDLKKAHRMARQLQAGTVWINTYNLYDAAGPFGGYKQSGFGRELSGHALEAYTNIKHVWVDLGGS